MTHLDGCSTVDAIFEDRTRSACGILTDNVVADDAFENLLRYGDRRLCKRCIAIRQKRQGEALDPQDPQPQKVDLRIRVTEYTLDCLEDAAAYYRSDVATLVEKAVAEALARHDQRMDEIEDFGGWQPAPLPTDWRRRTVKTSEMSPLRIAEIPLMPGYGDIGVTLCPGKKTAPGDDGMTGPWNRDLDLDMDEIKEWGASAVLTLIEPHEMKSLQVEGLQKAVEDRGMVWHHVPIQDHSTPDLDAENAWVDVGFDLRARLRRGERVLVHCRGGIGRAGTMAARLIVELGVAAPATALIRVRAARPGAVENACQERLVLGCVEVPDES